MKELEAIHATVQYLRLMGYDFLADRLQNIIDHHVKEGKPHNEKLPPDTDYIPIGLRL